MPGVVAATSAPSEKVVIKTDLYTATVDTLGAVLTEVALSAHRDTNDESKPYVLLQKNAERTFVAQTGLLGEGFPNHRTPWQALPGPRELASGVNELVLTLRASAANGDKVEQKLTFHRGSYVIDVAYDVTNAGTAPIAPYAYFQLTRDTKAAVVQSSMAPAAYTGPVLYNETDKFKKLEFTELDKLATDPNRKKLGDFYASCMDSTTADRAGTQLESLVAGCYWEMASAKENVASARENDERIATNREILKQAFPVRSRAISGCHVTSAK